MIMLIVCSFQLRLPLCKRHSTEALSVAAAGEGSVGNVAKRSSVTSVGAKALTVITDTQPDLTMSLDGEIFDLCSPKLPCDVNNCNFCFEV